MEKLVCYALIYSFDLELSWKFMRRPGIYRTGGFYRFHLDLSWWKISYSDYLQSLPVAKKWFELPRIIGDRPRSASRLQLITINFKPYFNLVTGDKSGKPYTFYSIQTISFEPYFFSEVKDTEPILPSKSLLLFRFLFLLLPTNSLDPYVRGKNLCRLQ